MKQTRTIEVDGKKYTVSFAHEQATHPRLMKMRQITICRIATDSGMYVSKGIAYRRPTEPFNEVEGRSKAFQRAVVNFAEHNDRLRASINIKTAFFQAFYNPPAKAQNSSTWGG